MFLLRGQFNLAAFEKLWSQKVFLQISSDYEEISSILVCLHALI